MLKFILLLLAAQDPTVKLPSEIPGQPGQFIPVQADTNGKAVKYVPLDSGLNVFPSALLADPKSTVVTSVTPGRYRLLAYSALGDKPSEPVVVVIVVGNAPKPPSPNPPQPTPPIPPSPPAPDELTQALQSIYGALREPEQKKNKDALAAVFKNAAGLCDDPALKTVGELYLVVRQSSRKSLPESALLSLRERIAEELNRKLPTGTDEALTAESRAKIAATYSTIARVLESLHE